MHQPRSLASAAATALLVLLVGLIPAAAQPLPAGLQNVPQNAPLVLYIPSLAGLAREVAALDQTLGLNVPVLADALATAKQMSGFNLGIDDQGPFIAILTDPAALTGESPEPPVVALLPVTSYEEFLKNFGAVSSQGVVQLTMPDGRPGWAKPLGSFVVVGASQAVVESFAGGAGQTQWLADLIGPQSLPYLAEADAALIVNVSATETKLTALLEQGLQNLSGMMKMGMAMDPNAAAQAGMAQAMVDLYADAARAWLRDTAGLVVAASQNDKGLALTFTSYFEPNSPLAQRFAKPVPASSALLDRLPKQDYLLALAMTYEGLDLPALVKDVRDRLQASGDTTILPLLNDGAVEMVQHSQATAGMFNLLPMMAMMSGGNPFVGMTIVKSDDAPALAQAMRKYYQGLSSAAAQPLPASTSEAGAATQPPAPLFVSEYQENVLQLDGIPVDRFSFRVQPPSAATGGVHMESVPGQEGYVAAVDSFLITTPTPDVELLRQGLSAVKATTGLGSDPGIQRVRQEGLPSQPMFEGYVNTRVLANTLNGVLAMMMAPPVDVPQDLPPIGIGASLREGAIVKRLYIPMPVIQFGGQAFHQIMAAQQAAPQPPGSQPEEESGEQPQPNGDSREPADAPPAPF